MVLRKRVLRRPFWLLTGLIVICGAWSSSIALDRPLDEDAIIFVGEIQAGLMNEIRTQYGADAVVSVDVMASYNYVAGCTGYRLGYHIPVEGRWFSQENVSACGRYGPWQLVVKTSRGERVVYGTSNPGEDTIYTGLDVQSWGGRVLFLGMVSTGAGKTIVFDPLAGDAAAAVKALASEKNGERWVEAGLLGLAQSGELKQSLSVPLDDSSEISSTNDLAQEGRVALAKPAEAVRLGFQDLNPCGQVQMYVSDNPVEADVRILREESRKFFVVQESALMVAGYGWEDVLKTSFTVDSDYMGSTYDENASMKYGLWAFEYFDDQEVSGCE